MASDTCAPACIKEAAQQGSVAMNDTAAGLALAAAVVSILPSGPYGLGAATALGVSSAVAWFLGNRFQAAANDPPRNDFDQVSLYQAPSLEFPNSTDGFTGAWNQLATEMISTELALSALIASLERFAGATIATQEQAQAVQLEAIRYNGMAYKDLIGALLLTTPRANLAWFELHSKFPSSVSNINFDVFADLQKKGTSSAFYNASIAKLGVYDFKPVSGYDAPSQAPFEMPPAVLLTSRWYSPLQRMQDDCDEVLGPYDILRDELIALQSL